MGRRKETPWTEMHRYPLGVSIQAGRDHASFCVLWSVDETRMVNGKPEWRNRVARGAYLRSQGDVDAVAMMLVCATAAKELSRLADIKEAKMERLKKGKRRGRS